MKIFCLGFNYPSHNKEMDSALLEKEPVVFLKSDSALLKDGKPFFIPDFMGRIDYEGELVVRICKLGKGISERFANRYYDAVTVGVDFTARDMQKKAMEEGLPWDICKGFDGAATLGEWIPKEQFLSVDNLQFRLDINGKTVQEANTCQMIHKVDAVISYLSKFYTLKTGDIIYTGTPAGVGPVNIDDHIEGYIENRKVLEFNCK